MAPPADRGACTVLSPGPEGAEFAVKAMNESASRRVAWSIGIASILLMLASLVVLFIDRHAKLPNDATRWSASNVINMVVNLAVPSIGIVLATKRRDNRLGWLFLVAGAALGIEFFADLYSQHALEADPGSLPLGNLFAWVSNWIWAVPFAMLVYLLLLFPTGALPSRRWRPAAWAMTGGFVAIVGLAMGYATAAWSFPFGPAPNRGLSVAIGHFLTIVGTIVVPLTIATAFVALVVRYRRSVGQERLQMKWFVTAAALVAVTFPLSATINTPLVDLLSNLALLFLWVAIVVAVTKYRLYEIDVVISRAVVFGTLAAFISLVYVALVVGIGTAIGNRGSPVLSAVAAAVVALAFQPVRQRARHLANRVVFGRRATPYEVLSEFAERISGAYSSDEVLPEMAAIVAAGTGATRTVIWLRVGNELRPVASAGSKPPSAAVPFDGEWSADAFDGDTAVRVSHQDEVLGTISLRMPASEPLGPAGERLLADVASQAGLVLSNARLIEELRASRQRLVAAQDAARRRLERNLHDGAQQQLVALAVKQRLVASLVTKDPVRAAEMLEGLQADTTDAIENLRDLARGIYPPLLADKGLVAALTAQARKVPFPVEVEVQADGLGRYSQDVEAAVYFCCLEALQNVAKYADAHGARVRLAALDGTLLFEVADDGEGFDPARTPQGSGLQNMADRLAALGGTVTVRSAPGEGTVVAGRLPLGTDATGAGGSAVGSDLASGRS